MTSGPTPEPVLGRQPSSIRSDDAASGDDLPVYTPYLPLLRARWMFCAAVAVCCLLPGAIMHHVPAPTAIAMWTFSVAGLVGLWWSHRWFRAHASDAEPQPLDVVELSWLRRVRYPLLVIAGLLAVAAPGSLRPGLGITAAVAAAGAGANLAAAFTAARWQRGSAHRLLAPAGRRMFIGRHALRADSRPEATARPHRRSPMVALLVTLAVTSACCLAMIAANSTRAASFPGPPEQVHATGPSLSWIASQLAQRPVPVTCWTDAQLQRYQREHHQQVGGIEDGGAIYLAPRVCAWIEWTRAPHDWPDDADTRYWMAYAAGALTHEIGHVVDGPDESGAECYAIAHMGRTLLMLGVDQDHAAELTEIYRDRVHPGMPPAYTHPC